MKDNNRNFSGRVNPVAQEAPAEELKNRTGHITGCELLNVRKDPDMMSPVIAQLTRSDTVMIREKNSVSDFFKVTTPGGVSGYCAKNYIAFND